MRTYKSTFKRGTIYFRPDLHQALRLRAATTGESLSQIVNSMVKNALAEEALDLDGFVLQEDEPKITFETFISDLRRRGRL